MKRDLNAGFRAALAEGGKYAGAIIGAMFMAALAELVFVLWMFGYCEIDLFILGCIIFGAGALTAILYPIFRGYAFYRERKRAAEWREWHMMR